MADGSEMRFSAQEFATLLDWFMVSDPWPLSEDEHVQMKEMLNVEAQARGYGTWVHAYHALGDGDAQ